jgi:DNA primase
MVRRHAPEVVTFFDGDAAGKRAAARSFPIFIEAGIWAKGLSLPDGEDPDTFVRTAGPDALRERIRGAVPLVEAYVEHTVASSGRDTAALARVGADLAAILAKLNNPFEYDLLVKKAAFATGISEDVLRRESRQGRGGARPAPPSEAREPSAMGLRRGGAPGPEEWLVCLLLTDREVAPVLAERGVVERMEESVWRDLAHDIIESVEAGRAVDSAEALARLPEFWRNRVASRLLEDAIVDPAVRTRVLEDCIRRREEAGRRRHNATLLGDMRKTEQIRSGEIPHETLTGWRPRTSSDA